MAGWQDGRMAGWQKAKDGSEGAILQSWNLTEATRAAFATGGPLTSALADFEPRPGQIEMAAAVADVFDRGGVLLAEAGTGTGKTLAYLVPAILKRERVLISTGTKNLQEQIFFKDIPALRSALGVPFTATCMKGRANYLCLHKLDQLTGDGDTLLCADAAVRQNAYGEVIPACSHAIVDEAHQLEDIATQYFGVSVSSYRVEELARDVERELTAMVAGNVRAQHNVEQAVEKLRDYGRSFFTELAWAHRGDGRVKNEERVRATVESLADAREAAAGLTGALDIVEDVLLRLKPDAATLQPDAKTDDDGSGDRADRAESIGALARRAGELRDDLRLLMRANDDAYVYFVEFRGRGVFLRASPIDVSTIVRELLLDRMQTTVLTSATLTVDGTFEYIRSRLGIRNAGEVRLSSEFDYGQQAVLYLPPRMPDPRSDRFAAAAGREVVEILRRTRGRAFVLFTSYAMLRAVQAIAEMSLDYPILAQGVAPRSQLLRQFRETPNAVLFATSSFWQGVDVAGDALSCVIVDKLPFASPADPITAARIEAIRARGGDPFAEYQVPLAILMLQQGLGRLIRHRCARR